MTDPESFLAQFKSETIGLALHDMDSGVEYFYHADEPFHPASTFKVAVLMEAFHQADEGLFSLDDQIPILNSFTSIADGSSFSVDAEDDADRSLYEQIGSREKLREILRLMIVRSSNLATNIVIQRLGAGRVTLFLKELGVEGVEVLRGPEDNKAYALGMNNRATARGLMQMMRVIADGKVVSRAVSDEMIRILLGQEFNEGIPASLPQTVKVAHKTGWNDKLYHDFGILFPKGRNPFVLVVMTRGFEKDRDAHACVARISRLIYEQICMNI